METRYKRFLLLAAWGFNVPVFLINPEQKYPRDTFVHLKENEFMDIPDVSLLVEKEATTRFFSCLRLQNAVAMLLEFRRSGYDTLLYEFAPWEFKGIMSVERRGGGSYQVWPEFESDGKIFAFRRFEEIGNLRLRHVAREAERVRECAGADRCFVEFYWTIQAAGVKCSKLVLYNFKKI
jgi:hypothetical protein